jgi:group I intron endonuclease
MTIYYIYAYTRPDGTPYYIGKGKGDRAYRRSHIVPLPKNKSQIIMMESNLTEVGALALERFYIRWYGRKDIGTGILRNMTNGGDGASGYVCTEDHRKKMSEAMTGNKNPMFGKKLAYETRRRMSESKSGNNHPMFGKKHTEETKKKMSESLIGKPLGPQSEEHKRKRVESTQKTKNRRISL